MKMVYINILLFTFIFCKTATFPRVDFPTIVLINGLLIDGTGAPPDSNVSVLIQNGIIQDIGQSASWTIPEDSEIIDVQGKAILPGFFNTHVHGGYSRSNLRAWAQDGITTLRDLGNLGRYSPQESYDLRDNLHNESLNARLVAAGPIITTSGGYGNFYVTSPEDARQKINTLIDLGTDLIKIAIEDDLQGRQWPMLSLDEIKTIVITAHQRGIPVSAHISRSRHLQMAIEAGVDDVVHMIVDELTHDLIEKMIQQDMYWIPTMELWKGVDAKHSVDWSDRAMSNLRRFHQAGGKVAVGTDYDGYIVEFDLGMPIRELRWMQEAGMSPAEIIVSATRHSAHVCNMETELGTIEEGKRADLIVVEDNPLEYIDTLKEVRLVIHNGLIIKNIL